MNPIEQVTLAFQALRHTIPQLWRGRLWVWALPLAAVECAVVASLWHAAHPWVSWFMAPLLLRFGGADTLHYPRMFELMPAIYERADLVIGAILGSIAIGAATPVFAARFRGEALRPLPALVAAFRRAPDFVLVLLPFNLLLFALSSAADFWLAHRAAGGIVGRALPLVVTAGSLALQAAFFYAASLVALEGHSAWAALRRLPGTWRPGYLAAFLVSATTLLLLTPIHTPGVTASLLVERGTPELAGLLTLLHVLAGLLTGFILTGAATLLYLSVVRGPGERA